MLRPLGVIAGGGLVAAGFASWSPPLVLAGIAAIAAGLSRPADHYDR